MIKTDILVFSTHPDDAELGCGGSLVLAVQQGMHVTIADLSEGENSSRGTPALRQKEKEKAAEILGIQQRVALGLPDTRIGTEPEHEQPVIELIRALRPHTVLIPYWQDRHPDHVAAAQLLQRAIFYAGVARVGNGRSYRPQQTICYMHHFPFQPTFVVDVTDVWPQRMAALAAYSSQFYVPTAAPNGNGSTANSMSGTALSGPGFIRFIEARAIWFGAMIGAAYGEPFLTTGPVALPGLPGIAQEIPISVKGPAYRMF